MTTVCMNKTHQLSLQQGTKVVRLPGTALTPRGRYDVINQYKMIDAAKRIFSPYHNEVELFTCDKYVRDWIIPCGELNLPVGGEQIVLGGATACSAEDVQSNWLARPNLKSEDKLIVAGKKCQVVVNRKVKRNAVQKNKFSNDLNLLRLSHKHLNRIWLKSRP